MSKKEVLNLWIPHEVDLTSRASCGESAGLTDVRYSSSETKLYRSAMKYHVS